MRLHQRKFRFLLVVLFFVFLGCNLRVVPGYTQEDPQIVVTITVESLNVRSGPGESYVVTGQLVAGEQVTVVDFDEATGWIEIRLPEDQTTTGWIDSQFTDFATQATATPAATIPDPLQTTTASPTPFSVAPAPEQPGIVELTFAELDASDIDMKSPIDQKTVALNLPYRWEIIGTDEQNDVTLHYDVFHADVGVETEEEGQSFAEANPLLEVYLNNELITTFTPQVGQDQTRSIPIPPESMAERESNRHFLRFAFKTSDCENPGQTRVVIHESSLVHLEYQVLPIELDLKDFPRPLLQDLLDPEVLMMILPEDYSDTDLSAAASLAATLGNRGDTKEDVIIDLVTADQVTPALLANRSAIIIGQPTKNSFLRDLYQRDLLPTSFSAQTSQITATNILPIAQDDGILQLILSDVSPDKAYLVVTGMSDAGVHRAARALSYPPPGYISGNLSVVSAVDEEQLRGTAELSDTITLKEMGYYETIFSGVGTQRVIVGVFIPANWRITHNPRLFLRYLHSSALDPALASLNILLNQTPIGSAPLRPEHEGELQVEIDIPMSDFHPGQNNYLTFESVVQPSSECILPPEGSTWMRVLDSSYLHIPHTKENTLLIPPRDPLALFASRQDMGDILFSLPEEPSAQELRGLLEMSWLMGKTIDGKGFTPRVARGIMTDTISLTDTVKLPQATDDGLAVGGIRSARQSARDFALREELDEVLQSYHVIAFGLPTSNPFIRMINDELPQPFVPGTTLMSQQVGDVVYRLPPDMNLGLIEFLLSPWNSRKALAIVTGTSQQGVSWSINAMTEQQLLEKLAGDVNFILEQHVESVNTQKLTSPPMVESVQRVAETPLVQETVTPAASVEVITSTNVISEAYLPQLNDSSGTVSLAILGMIAVGAGIAVVGTLFTLFKWRIRKKPGKPGV